MVRYSPSDLGGTYLTLMGALAELVSSNGAPLRPGLGPHWPGGPPPSLVEAPSSLCGASFGLAGASSDLWPPLTP